MRPFDHEAALAACARRDALALRGLYEHDGAMLLAVALRIVRRREIALDVLHDAFLDIWQNAPGFDSARGSGRGWIVSITRHRALKAVRQASRETPLDATAAEAVADEGPDPLSALAASEEGRRLGRCLGELPAERRQAVLLAYTEGLSQSEIAARLGAPLGTVKAWIRRSLLSLRECLR